MIRTKICGISSNEDMRIAENSGTDAIGFLVGQKHNATGFISIDFAAELCQKASPFVSTVVVTHLTDITDILQLANKIKPTALQLHSDLSVDKLILIKNNLHSPKIISKVSISDESSIERAIAIQDYSDAILLDSIDIKNDKVGGTGTVHDWNISKKIVELLTKPVILAGGLNYENVMNAIATVKPWAVDVNTGVTINGRKSSVLANAFVLNAKSYTMQEEN